MIIRNRTTKTGITKTLKASSLNNRWYADRRTSGQVGKDVNDPVRVAPRWCHGYPFRVYIHHPLRFPQVVQTYGY